MRGQKGFGARTALVLGAFAAALALFGQSASPAARPPGYAMDVKISPAPEGASQYVCEAKIQDLATGETVFNPHVQVLAGKSGVASSDADGGKRDYVLSVSIEGEGKQANFHLAVHEGETEIASQRASVKLR
jgi:hypothetical protein